MLNLLIYIPITFGSELIVIGISSKEAHTFKRLSFDEISTTAERNKYEQKAKVLASELYVNNTTEESTV